MTVLVNQTTRIVKVEPKGVFTIPFTGTVLQVSAEARGRGRQRQRARQRLSHESYAALEPVEHVDEQLEAVAVDPGRAGPRRRRRR